MTYASEQNDELPSEEQRPPRLPLSPAEKYILSGVATILLSMIVPLLLGLQAARLQRMAEADIRALLRASDRFFAEYGRWPTARMGTINDVRYGDERSNAEVIHMLRGVAGPGNENHQGNPHRIVFLEVGRSGFRRSGINADGAFVDPWGMQYQIAIDTDMNDVVTMIRSAYPNLLATSVAIWSSGPDRRSDTSQDIVSWE